MTAVHPEEHARPVVLHQQWRHVSFIHWPVAASAVAAKLPDGLTPDLFDGEAWISITPFAVCGERALGLPAMPRLSNYGELNLRTYVVGPDGRDGLWFLSLDVSNPVTAAAARAALGVPYRLSHVDVAAENGTLRYRGRRVRHSQTQFAIDVVVGDAIERQSSLDTWLTGRWRAWTSIAGRLAYVPVRHQPWPLRRATLRRCEQTVTTAHHVPDPPSHPLVQYASSVEADLSAPRPHW